jgi:hypothetical protein
MLFHDLADVQEIKEEETGDATDLVRGRSPVRHTISQSGKVEREIGIVEGEVLLHSQSVELRSQAGVAQVVRRDPGKPTCVLEDALDLDRHGADEQRQFTPISRCQCGNKNAGSRRQ